MVLLLPLLLAGPARSGTLTAVDALYEFAAEKRYEAVLQRAEVEAFARQWNIPIRRELADGQVVELMRIRNGRPEYNITENAAAAVTTRTDLLWPISGLGYNVTGAGYSALGEWDGGGVLTIHQEFDDGSGSRVTQIDSPTSISSHSTHVAGTMVAAGVYAPAKGMAFAADLKAYDWNSDDSEMALAAADGLELSNHSWFISIFNFNPGTSYWY